MRLPDSQVAEAYDKPSRAKEEGQGPGPQGRKMVLERGDRAFGKHAFTLRSHLRLPVHALSGRQGTGERVFLSVLGLDCLRVKVIHTPKWHNLGSRILLLPK